MDKIRNLSLRRTLVLYLAIGLSVALFLAAIVRGESERTQQAIYSKYIDMETEELVAEYGTSFRLQSYILTEEDSILIELYDVLYSWSTVIFSLVAAILAVFLFYRDKLKKPLALLSKGSEKITQNTLDFKIHYDRRDEMGQLSDSFELMRQQLYENNRNLWRAVEEQKMIRSAIAHDIRTPLSIIKGYNEMLLEFIPGEKLEKKNMIELLRSSQGQIQRLETFVDTMKQISSLEERTPRRKEINMESLYIQVKESFKIYTDLSYPEFELQAADSNVSAFYGDMVLIMEVIENIISNAVRFANKKIKIYISANDDFLRVNISDDGAGFGENADLAVKAYYHNNPQENAGHFGLGLYLSKQLCELHGGTLELCNPDIGGASVTACFKIR